MINGATELCDYREPKAKPSQTGSGRSSGSRIPLKRFRSLLGKLQQLAQQGLFSPLNKATKGEEVGLA
jgi:hypothetical protein